MANLSETRFADFSKDRLYRYCLKIVWDDRRPILPVCGLNPSIADERRDDPTVRRWKGYAQAWGFGGIVVLNLFALISTDPAKLREVKDPVGPLNSLERFKAEMANANANWVLASWGRLPKKLQWRADVVKDRLGRRLMCLGRNADGSPVHPLYQKKDLKPVLWS